MFDRPEPGFPPCSSRNRSRYGPLLSLISPPRPGFAQQTSQPPAEVPSKEYNLLHATKSLSTIGGGGDTTIPPPGRSPKENLPGIGLHDPLHCQQAFLDFNSFQQGVGQICPRERLFSCRPLSKRGQICDIPHPLPIVEPLLSQRKSTKCV